MHDFPDTRAWLLLDAAGPVAVAGVAAGGRWLGREEHEGEFLEWLEPAVRRVLDNAGLTLEQLGGALYAAGPGSTLGLRLAAMFLRGLLALPALRHWECLAYHNLEVALADAARAGGGPAAAVCPWRRDRLHHAALEAGRPLRFSHGWLAPEEAAARGIPGVLLGRRPANAPGGTTWRDYPHQRLPELLHAFPELLSPTPAPAPYAAGDAEFARWSSRRHTAT